MLAFINALSPMHLLLLGLVALLLFGKRLPEVGRSLGKGIMEFKKGLKDVTDDMDRDDEPRQSRRKLRSPPEDLEEDEFEDEDDVEEEPVRKGARKSTH